MEGDDCPASVQLHGVENLLHRAAAGGSSVVVSELLKCGGRDVRAKNHDGEYLFCYDDVGTRLVMAAEMTLKDFS